MNVTKTDKAAAIMNEAFRVASIKVKKTKDYSTDGWNRFVGEALCQLDTSMFSSRKEIEELFFVSLEVSASSTKKHLQTLGLRYDFF